MKLTENMFQFDWINSKVVIRTKEPKNTIQQILKNQDNIPPDKAFDYVMENMYDMVKEAVFEQEADNLEP